MLYEELLAIGIVALLLFASIGVAWREGYLDDPAARRGAVAGGAVALIALAVTEFTSLPWPIETAAVVGAVLAVSGLLRYSDRVRAAIEG